MPADPGSARLALATARFFAARAQEELSALWQDAVVVQRAIESDLKSIIESRATRGSDPVQRAPGSDASHDAFEAFKHYVEAAIVFGRTVTFRLQAEYNHLPSFEPWYSQQRKLMSHDPLFTFFRDERNLILKKREVSLSRNVSVTVESSGGLSTSTIGGVYRTTASGSMSVERSHTISFEDPEWEDRFEDLEWEDFFEDPKWEDRNALSLVTEYLDRLEATVNSARNRFGRGP